MNRLLPPAPLPGWIGLGFLVLISLTAGAPHQPAKPAALAAAQTINSLQKVMPLGPSQPPSPLSATEIDEESSPPPGPSIRIGGDTLAQWSHYHGDADLQTYVVGKVRLTMSQAQLDRPFWEREGLRVEVRAPGMKRRTLSWPDNGRMVKFGVGRLDRARPGPQILLLRWTLGAHCCYVATLLTPEGDHWRVEDLDEWDDGNLWPTTFNPGEWPRDRDGDGTPELLVPDERFRYVFEAYVASIAPLRLQQIHKGQMIDVSDRRAFRPLFEATLPLLKENCDGKGTNGYCAAYVATASRLGQRRQAWAWMLKRRDSHIAWSEEDCRNLVADQALCPRIVAADQDSFPLALEAFLEQTGYPS